MLHSVSVKDYMAGSVVTLKPSDDVLHAIDLFLANGISGAPVVDQMGNIVGLLSEKDCMQVGLKASYMGSMGGTVADFMTANVVSVDAETSIMEVAKMFQEAPYKRYPVVSDNRLVGQISRRDVLRAIQEFASESSFA